MVQTIKFSQFTANGLPAVGDKEVGLKSGANTIFTQQWTWYAPGTTAQRPTSPVEGILRFNTDLHLYEYYDGLTAAWEQLVITPNGGGTVLPSTANNLAYYATNGDTVSGLPTAINSVLITDASGVPSLGTTLPSAVQLNITKLGIQSQALDMGTHLIHNVVDPVSAQDAATKQYVDSTIGLLLPLSPTNGGTGVSNPTAHGIMIAEGSSPMTPIVLSTGQILIGSTGADPVAAAINSGTGILVGNGAGSITVSLASIATLTGLVNLTGGSAAPVAHTLTEWMDSALGSTRGQIIYRNATVWTVLAPGTAGFSLQTGGAGADPSYSNTFTNSTLVTPATLGVQQQALNMNSHLINNVTDPVSAQDAATKAYVDQTALTGTSVYAASAGSLGTVTQSGSGAGASLTNAGAMATFALDGTNPPVGANVLIKNTATGMTAANEGIYTVQNAGSPSTNWVLVRATSYDTSTEINRTGLIVVQNGSTLANTGWVNSATIVTVDTTNFNYVQFGFLTPVSLANGGTNASLTASNGGIVYSTATAMAILNGTATAGLALLSGSSTTPSWSTLPPITKINIQTFTTGTSTYTPTTGMVYCTVEIVAAGGGSGGAAGTAGQCGSSGGAGGGGYCRKTYTAALIGANATVVIGAVGSAGSAGNNAGGNASNSTFTPAGAGAVLTAGGGVGSAGAPSSATVTSASGGTGGTATGGDVNIPGNAGTQGQVVLGSAQSNLPGQGGGTPLCPGGTNNPTFNGSVTSKVYGSGAAGTASGGGADVAGAAGAAGICYITEYISV